MLFIKICVNFLLIFKIRGKVAKIERKIRGFGEAIFRIFAIKSKYSLKNKIGENSPAQTT